MVKWLRMKQRIETLREILRDSSLDAALVTSGVNIRYYSGFTSSDGMFLVTHKVPISLRIFAIRFRQKRRQRDIPR